MNDDYNINDLDARSYKRRQLATICRYSLMAIAVVTGAIAWRCEPHEACSSELAECESTKSLQHGVASECRRWTP